MGAGAAAATAAKAAMDSVTFIIKGKDAPTDAGILRRSVREGVNVDGSCMVFLRVGEGREGKVKGGGDG